MKFSYKLQSYKLQTYKLHSWILLRKIYTKQTYGKAPIKVNECGKIKIVFKNKHWLAPQWSFRLLIYGNSRCSKTNSLLEFFYDRLYFKNIYLYAKDIEEDKYKYLRTKTNVLKEKFT